MPKPVEIEILMRDRLTSGLDKSSQGMDRLLGAARRASLEIQGEIEKQRKVISGLNTDLGKMESKLQGMKPGDGQRQLLVEVNACKKALADETEVLARLEREHEQARQSVSQLEQEYKRIAQSEEQAAAQSKDLTSRIAEQKAIVKQTETDVQALQKAYDSALPGRSKQEALAELNAAKKALDEDKAALAGLTSEQKRNEASNRRLAMQLRDMQNAMSRMRMEGKQNTEEYRQMAEKAAVLSDTLADVKRQTSILSNDDANLQGLISGVNGLSGAFTTATGVMSLFAAENENLQKVQARLQSVMAITMGLQQVFNALNKDSAFRLVTLTRAKELLTAANTRLAVTLGISNTAASVLMGTLTLGLSVAITGLIVLWDKYSTAQEEAKRKSLEMVETEAQGRAEMLKTRFEIDNTRESLHNFTGTKEEEKQKCEELNRKYGEAFGYYYKVSEWYDVLTGKAEQYVQMLFLQAKAQALVNRATEADNKLNEHKATKPGNAETDMGFWSQLGLYGTVDPLTANDEIKKYNKEAYDKRTKELEKERDNALKEAADLQKQAAAIGKGANIGGHTPTKHPTVETTFPTTPKPAKQEKEPDYLKQLTDSLLKLQAENRQGEVSVIDDDEQRTIAQAEKDYTDRLAELEGLAKRWRELNEKTQQQTGQDGLTYEQRDEIRQAQVLAEQQRNSSVRTANEQATAKRQKAQEEQNSQNFQQLKESIDWDHVFSNLDRMTTEALETLKGRLNDMLKSGQLNPQDAKTLTEAIHSIEGKLTERGDFWASLFPALRNRNKEPKEGEKKTSAVGDIFSNAVSMAGGGALGIGKLIQTNANSMAELTDKIGLGQTEFGEAVHGFADGVNGFMGATQSLASGDVFGAVSGIIDGIGGFGEMFGVNWSGGNEAEYAKAMEELTQKNADLIVALDSLREELANSTGALAIDAYNKARDAQRLINDNTLRMVREQMGYHSAHHSWGYYWDERGGFSQQELANIRAQRTELASWAGDMEHLTAEQAKALTSIPEVRDIIRNTGKGPYGESVLEQLDKYAELAGELQNLKDQLYETLTTTTKEDVFSGFLDSLYDLASGSETVFEDIADNWQAMQNKMVINNLVGAKFQKQLESWYESLGELNEQKAKGYISDTNYAARLNTLKSQYEDYVRQAQNDIELLREQGIIMSSEDDELSSNSSKRSSNSGGFSSMTYEQGSKLEGMFTNGLIVWRSIDGKMTDVATQMSRAGDTLARIENNTGQTAMTLKEIKSELETMKRDGIKVK